MEDKSGLLTMKSSSRRPDQELRGPVAPFARIPVPPPVCRRLTERSHLAEVDRRRRLKSDSVATVAVIGVDKLDTVRQITGRYGRMHGAFGDMQLICYHAFDDARSAIEISRDTPQIVSSSLQAEIRAFTAISVKVAHQRYVRGQATAVGQSSVIADTRCSAVAADRVSNTCRRSHLPDMVSDMMAEIRHLP
jgi:hypothetical protein